MEIDKKRAQVAAYGGGGIWGDVPTMEYRGDVPPWKNRENFESIIFFHLTHKLPEFEII